MELRDDTDALRAGRGVEIETIKLINFILVMRGKPVLRGRERISVLKLHIRRGEGKTDESLGGFGRAIRRWVFHDWRLPKRKQLVRNRIHVSALNGALMRTNRSVHQKLRREKSKISTSSSGA